MKKSSLISSLAAGSILIVTGLAQAIPNTTTACIPCHRQDSSVTVTVTQGSCLPDGSAKVLNIAVSNTYPGNEGWAVFDLTTNIRNGLGAFGSAGVPSNRTYRIYGVSNYASYQSPSLGGANVVYVVPTCPPTTCIDGDGDSFSVTPGCGRIDCNDGNNTINPGATEIKHDGIDQDCNGFDLTIDVIKASYAVKSGRLTVQATSGFGSTANLQAVVWGQSYPMNYSKKTGIWSLTLNTSPKPATISVQGFEGTETVYVQ